MGIGFIAFFDPSDFLSPVAGANVMLPYGVPFDSLSFLYLTSGHFFDLKILLGLSRFLTRQFFIPRCGSYAMLPYGVPFDSLSFLYLPSSHFFEFKIQLGLSHFSALQFFIP